jgi:hypothetical protein
VKRSNTLVKIEAASAFFVARITVIASVIKLRDSFYCGSGMLSAPD